jgi:atypical dual specificity phosphatase
MKTASALGRILVLDLVIRNEDRLVCQELGWRGNPGNLLVSDRCPLGFNKMSPQKMLSKTSSVQRRSELHCHKKSESFRKLASQSTSDLQQLASSELGLLESTKSLSIQSYLPRQLLEANTPLAKVGTENMEINNEVTKTEKKQCVIVAIDSGIPRRPPALKAQNDQRDYPKVVELLINDEKIAAELLKEISWENLGVESPKTGQGTDKSDKLDQLHSAKQIDHIKVVKAFQGGFTAGIRDMQILQMFLLKLFRQLDHLLKDFAVYMSAQSKSHEDGNKRLGSKPGSPQPRSQGVSVEGLGDSTLQTSSLSDQLSSSPCETHKLSSRLGSVSPSLSEIDHVQDSENEPCTEAENQSSTPMAGTILSGSPSTENTQVVSQRLLSSSQKPAPISVSPVTSTIMESPSTSSPSRQSWHKKGSPGRLTLKLKNVSKTAKVFSYNLIFI